MARYDAPSRGSGKQNTFFGGAAILAVGILVVKLIGMFYKIPLVNIIGAQGNTDFTNAYNIYAVLLTISTAGLPVAVSKLVSEANAQGRRGQVRRTFQLALGMFVILGLVSFLVMYFKADMLAEMMHDTKAAPGIRALSPAVVCVGCLAALRGYTQGHLNMTPTSISQIIEALCKLFIGLSLAYALIKMGQPPEMAAAGAPERAIFAVSACRYREARRPGSSCSSTSSFSWQKQLTMARSMSSPPRRLSPAMAVISMMFSKHSTMLTSSVPPPKSTIISWQSPVWAL